MPRTPRPPPLARGALVAFACALAFGSSPRAARAQGGEPSGGPSRDWHLEAGVGTDVPVQVGARVGLEAPGRIRVSTSLGFLPAPYVDAINGVLVGVGAYGRDEADLVSNTLSSSLVWRTHVGIRPFADAGFYADAGYGLVALGGGGTAAEIIAGLTGRDPPPNAGQLPISARSTLHMLDVELGWRFPIGAHFAAWTALGGAFTLGSSTSLSPEATGNARVDAAVKQIADDGARRLDDIYTSYVFTPVLSAGAAYVFF
ncbi:MAG TPA: hypothetical protein VFS43_08725 [Polyangiaceae bacterium]|nr:hypothetical protein [Polyangiaceae bacterium]